MSHLCPAADVPDGQLSLALARVHGRLRRRRNGVRGAGAAALACVALLGVGVATHDQGGRAHAPTGAEAVAPAEGASNYPRPEVDWICGRALASALDFGLELTIQGPVEWRTSETRFAAPAQVVVVARNAGTRSLTVSFPPSVVGLGGQELVDTERAAPVMMPTTVALEPSEVVELPAVLPDRSCTGDVLGRGTYRIAPVVAVADGRYPPSAVLGSPVVVQHH